MVEPRRVIVTGATGLIGRALCAELNQRGDAVVVFSRDPDAAHSRLPGAAEYVAWQPQKSGPWSERLDGASAVVNLAGGPLFTFGKRLRKADVRAETQSRIQGIRRLVHVMEVASSKPATFVSASSVGTYGYAGFSDDMYIESSPPGDDFWGQDSRGWEEAALDAERLGIRPVVLRTGYVLDATPTGGLAQQVAQFRRGFGGPVLPGRQWLP